MWHAEKTTHQEEETILMCLCAEEEEYVYETHLSPGTRTRERRQKVTAPCAINSSQKTKNSKIAAIRKFPAVTCKPTHTRTQSIAVSDGNSTSESELWQQVDCAVCVRVIFKLIWSRVAFPIHVVCCSKKSKVCLVHFLKFFKLTAFFSCNDNSGVKFTCVLCLRMSLHVQDAMTFDVARENPEEMF